MGGRHRSPGPMGTSSDTNTGQPPGPAGYDPRKQAKELHAANAQEIVRASLPFVIEHMTAAQFNRMQRVLDAEVVDPVVKAEADAVYARSTKYSGSLVFHDAALVHRYEQMMQHYVYINDADKRIRLDLKEILDPDALKPVTDNPDEARYLERVARTLAEKGIWLRFEPKLVRDRDDPSRHVLDPRAYDVWLSIGPDGDAIDTTSELTINNGRITREALLNTKLLGAGYYQCVYTGPVQRALEKEARRLEIDIQSGLEQHWELAKIRRDAPPFVAGISDLLGGADFPDESIWQGPHKLVMRALELNVSGNVKASQAFLVQAGLAAHSAAKLLADYINDTSTGAERAAKAARVVKVAAEVTEAALTVYGAYAGFGAIGAAEGGMEAKGARLVTQFEKDNPEFAAELRQVKVVRSPKGSIGGGVKPGSSSGAGQGLLNKDPGF